MYKTIEQADKVRAIWNEAMNSHAANLNVSCMAFDAGDNAAATLIEAGKDFRDQDGLHTNEFVYWWEMSLVASLSDHCGTFNNEEVRAWYADRGIEA